MAYSVFPAPSAASKTRYVETLTSGSSWTVPTGVTYVNATLIGAGGGGGSGGTADVYIGDRGNGGTVITSNLTTTPANTIAYAIGAGGSNSATTNTAGGDGGSTTFTGATTAVGGNGGAGGASSGGVGRNGTDYLSANNGGTGGRRNINGGVGGNGVIILEYWK